MGISADQFADARKTALKYARSIDTTGQPVTWLPQLLDRYEKELTRLDETDELTLIIADLAKELHSVRESHARLRQGLLVIAADDLLTRPGKSENEVRKEIAREVLTEA